MDVEMNFVERQYMQRKAAIIGLQEAISDLRFIRTATKDAQIAALAGSAALVAELYLKASKGETK